MMLPENRERIRTNLDVNFVVEAGAGTGKTTLLIERLCFALLQQNIPAVRLVALTFTEKAAAEITTRLIFQLQALLRTARQQKRDIDKFLSENKEPFPPMKELLLRFLPPAKDNKQKRTNQILITLQQHFELPLADLLNRAEMALTQLDYSQIGTIHSFCANILRTYPLDAGLTPNAEIDKGVRSNRIFEAQWNMFLDVELGENAPRPDKWKEVLAHVSLTDLYKCARKMCNGKLGRYDYFAQKDMMINLCQQYAARAEQLSKISEKGQKKPRTIEKALLQAQRRLIQTAQWLQTGKMPLESEKTIEIPSALPKDWPADAGWEAETLCDFAEQADPFVQQWMLTAYALLEDIVERVRACYAQEGILSFDDLIIKTRDLLQHNLKVRRLVQEQYDVFYIDEFQDTDPAQGEILLYLAAKKGEGAADWREVKLEPGKLFVVGDPKQSIYHFRGADISAYQLFTDLILQQGGEKAYLRENFRCEPDIIDLANEVGEKIMVASPNFQPAYEPIFSSKEWKNSATEMILIRPPSGAGANADGYRHNQAEQIANWIDAHVGRMKLNDGRTLQYKDIAILSRAATTVRPYTDALRRANIPFSIDEDKDFYLRQEVSDFLNFLRVLHDPQDRISLVGVMRSPLGGLTDDEIYQAAQRKELDFRKTSSDEKLERLFKMLRRFSVSAGREPLRCLLRRLLQETFLAEACAVAYDGERSMENLQRLVALGEGYSLTTPSTLGQFLARVEDLMEEEIGRLTALPEGESLNAVNVMTVHKSKGLEFPVVILADLSKQEVKNNEKRPLYLYSWKENLHGFRIGKYADINFLFLEAQDEIHARCEERRVLYVAMTRAKEKLVLVSNRFAMGNSMTALLEMAGVFPPRPEWKRNMWITPAEDCSEDEDEKPEIKEDRIRAWPESVGNCDLPVQYVPYVEPKEFIYRLFHRPSISNFSWDLTAWRQAYTKRQAKYEQERQADPLLAPSALVSGGIVHNVQAQQLGSWVHAALARQLQFPQVTLESALQTAGADPDSPIYKEAHTLLTYFYQTSVWQQMKQMKLLGAEMPFSLYTGEGVINGVMDVLAQDGKGDIWVFDYKTDHVANGEEAQAARKYKAQLAIYKQVAQKLYPSSKVKSAVVFVRSGTQIAVDIK